MATATGTPSTTMFLLTTSVFYGITILPPVQYLPGGGNQGLTVREIQGPQGTPRVLQRTPSKEILFPRINESREVIPDRGEYRV
jgi:hypothetical protein